MAHQILVLRYFSAGEISHPRQSRFSPSEWAREMADPSSKPFPIMDVSGLPEMLSNMATMVKIPGERCSSEYNASLAWFQTNRISGQ